MSTIKDVAKLAGVSLGTVSNVLNGKIAVNPGTVRRVQEAIDTLNYKPHQTARSLKTSRTMNVAVVLPDILDPMKASLFSGIERGLSQQGYAVSLYTTAEIATKETAIIERILEQRADGIIISTCQPKNTKIFEQLKQADVAVVLVERAVVGGDFHLVEFDNYSSIFSLTEKLVNSGKRNNLLIAGLKGYSCEDSCAEAFSRGCKEHGLNNSPVLRVNFNKESAFRSFTRFLQKNPLPDNVITTGTPLMNGVMKALEMQALRDEMRPGLFSLAEQNWAETKCADYTAIARRSIALGESAAECLLAEICRQSPADISSTRISNPEIKQDQADMNPGDMKAETIKVLMFDSPAYRALKSLIPDFKNKYGISTEFTALGYEEMTRVVSDGSLRSGYDVIQLDIPWIPDLVQNGGLLELSSCDEAIEDISKEFVPGVLSAYSRFNNGIYALPFMFGTQLLYYRKDLFEDLSLRLEFKERFGFELGVPRTWTEFNRIAEFFTRSINPDSPVEYGTTLGGKELSGAVCEFLPRLWAHGGSILDENGRINHDDSAFLKSLESYCESFRYAHPDSSEYWWDEQMRDFTSGKAAMMIMFIAHAVDLVDSVDSPVAGNIGYDLIPGGIPMLGGWSIGINSATEKAAASMKFLRWAASEELAIPQTILGGSTASISLYKNSELLTIYPWLPKALESFKSCRKRNISRETTGGRIGDQDFERILGMNVHNAVTGKISVEDAVNGTMNKISELL